MAEDDSSYDLEERTFRFALSVRICLSEQLRTLHKESDELVRILATIQRKSSS